MDENTLNSEQGSVGTDSGLTGQAEVDSSQTGKEQVAAGLPDGMTPDKLPDAYKSLQSEYTKNQQAYKSIQDKLSPYGGTDGILQWAEYLSSNTRFADWVKQEQQRQILGNQSESVDPETQKAMDIVQKIADQRIADAMKREVEPLAESYKQQIISGYMKQMDSDPMYAGWRDLQATMSELADKLPETTQDNPSLETLQDLYWMAARKSGKIQDLMAKQYEKVLKEKQKKTTDRPIGNAGQSIPVKPKSIREAFEMAKRQVG
jgi:hypothetical protein